MQELIITIIGFASAIIGAIITYILSKRKKKAEAQTSELNNVEKAIKIWRELTNDLKNELDAVKLCYHQMEGKYDELELENKRLTKRLDILTIENANLKKLIENNHDNI